MALRAIRNFDHLFMYQLRTTANIAAFTPVKFVTDDDHVTACDSNDPLMIGWVRIAVTKIGVDGSDLPVDLILKGMGIIPVTVASGQTATRGNVAVGVTGAGTYKNSPTINGGSTLTPAEGIFMQSGVAGDVVGMLVIGTNRFQLTA